MTFSEKLVNSKEYKFLIDYFRTIDFTNKEIYANWLAQTHYFVSHSVRLSALGASRCHVDDPLGRRMAAHTNEEEGHHVIARRDIEALGKKVSDYPPLGVTNAFYQSQYYRVLFEHPAHLLGQIFVLEHLATLVGKDFYEMVVKKFGEKATNFVRVHATEDLEHVKHAMKAIDSLSPEIQKGIEDNFYQATEMYFQILRSINEKSFRQILAA